MSQSALYDQALKNMEQTTELLASRVARPQAIKFKESFNFRYVEKTIHQALVQKLARLVSSLHATRLLMEAGFVQEQAALQRVLDEIAEDISFLSWSVIHNERTPLHEAYLNAFYQEEFSPDDETTSSSDRPMVPRKKIRAYLDRKINGSKGSSQNLETAKTVSKTYSGYVHAASPQIMDMYSENPPRFHMRGMRGTIRHREHRADFWNYIYRGISAFCIAAKAFGDEDLFNDIRQFNDEFVRQTAGDGLQSNEWSKI